MPDLSYAIIGTGALGGYYGARLQQAGFDVHFLLRSDYNYAKKHGLKINSKEGDFTLPQIQAYQRVEDMPPCDVVLLALKTTQNDHLERLLPPVLKPEGAVVVLQNGLGIEDDIAKLVGPERILGGLCFTCANKVGPGHVHHLDYGQITLGEYRADQSAAGLTKRMQELGRNFEKAKIPIALAEDLITARWKKLVWNIPFNGLTVVLDARTDELIGYPHTLALVKALMGEVLIGAETVHGRTIPDSFIDEMIETTHQMKPYKTSMKLDYDNGRPMEVEAIFGAPLRLAQKASLALPHLSMLYQQLKFLDDR